MQVYDQLGYWPKGYEPAEPPAGCESIWDLFWEIRNAAPNGFNGPVRISFAELCAWQQIRGHRLGNFLVDVLLQMDAAYIREWYRNSNKKD